MRCIIFLEGVLVIICLLSSSVYLFFHSVVQNGGEKCWIPKSPHRLENSHTALGICGIAYSEYCCGSVAGKGEFKDTRLIWKGDRW